MSYDFRKLLLWKHLRSGKVDFRMKNLIGTLLPIGSSKRTVAVRDVFKRLFLLLFCSLTNNFSGFISKLFNEIAGFFKSINLVMK